MAYSLWVAPRNECTEYHCIGARSWALQLNAKAPPPNGDCNFIRSSGIVDSLGCGIPPELPLALPLSANTFLSGERDKRSTLHLSKEKGPSTLYSVGT